MDAAVLAPRIVTRAVVLPLDPLEQRVVRREDAVREQVARALPAVGIARDRAPWRALELALAGKELLIDRAREPAVATLACDLADDPELLLVLDSRHRQLLIDLRVLVAGCDQHAVDADLVREVMHHLQHIVDRRFLEHGRVRRDAEARLPCLLDRVDGDVPKTGVVADVVVDLAHPVEVDDEGQAMTWLEDVEVLVEAERVRAQVDVLAELEHAGDDVLDSFVDERLAAADGHHRRRTLCARVHAFVNREPRFVRLVFADLSAADARDVAGEGRLEHEHERVAVALALLAGDVLADLHGRAERELHPFSLSLRRPRARSGNVRRYRW